MSEPHTTRPDEVTPPATRPPRPVPRRGRIAILGVACAALVAAVLTTLASVPDPLPEPRPLAHDPVPAERIRWTVPADCGIGPDTMRALVPDATADLAGDAGSCRWYVDPAKSGRSLEVHVTPHHAGPGVPGAAAAGNSSTAAAITALRTAGAFQGSTVTPLTGLGDEAVLSETSSAIRYAVIDFRVDNVTVDVQYSAEEHPIEGKPPSAGRLRAGVLRAAADVARHLGSAAAPKTAAATAPPAVHTPASVCGVVPSALRDRLLGSEDRQADPGGGDDDPYLSGSLLRGARTRTCALRSDGREVELSITTSTARTAARDIGREYLRRHLEARAEKPLVGTDERYFHALSGLGDQAFCAYLEESSSVRDVESPARIVVRSGTALISVVYGSDTDGYEADISPLTRDEAVDGAYAVAVRAARAVHP